MQRGVNDNVIERWQPKHAILGIGCVKQNKIWQEIPMTQTILLVLHVNFLRKLLLFSSPGKAVRCWKHLHSTCKRSALESNGEMKKNSNTELPWQASNEVLHFSWMISVHVSQDQYTGGHEKHRGRMLSFLILPPFALKACSLRSRLKCYYTSHWLRDNDSQL